MAIADRSVFADVLAEWRATVEYETDATLGLANRQLIALRLLFGFKPAQHVIDGVEVREDPQTWREQEARVVSWIANNTRAASRVIHWDSGGFVL